MVQTRSGLARTGNTRLGLRTPGKLAKTKWHTNYASSASLAFLCHIWLAMLEHGLGMPKPTDEMALYKLTEKLSVQNITNKISKTAKSWWLIALSTQDNTNKIGKTAKSRWFMSPFENRSDRKQTHHQQYWQDRQILMVSVIFQRLFRQETDSSPTILARPPNVNG